MLRPEEMAHQQPKKIDKQVILEELLDLGRDTDDERPITRAFERLCQLLIDHLWAARTDTRRGIGLGVTGQDGGRGRRHRAGGGRGRRNRPR